MVFFMIAVNRDAQSTGLGLVLWPIVVGLVCTYAFALKVFLIDSALRVPAAVTSKVWLAVLSIGAGAFALIAPPSLK
jgi:hypothetical protein